MLFPVFALPLRGALSMKAFWLTTNAFSSCAPPPLAVLFVSKLIVTQSCVYFFRNDLILRQRNSLMALVLVSTYVPLVRALGLLTVVGPGG